MVANNTSPPKTVDEARALLAEFFPPHFVRWKPAKFQKEAADLELLAYVDVRAVCDRLDAVFGPDGWETRFRELSGGAIECTLRVRFPGIDRWVRRTDVGSRSSQMPDPDDNLKTGYSDALKRAAVQLGIGRYLYRMGSAKGHWDGKRVSRPPVIPDRFLPADWRAAGPELADRAQKAVESLCAKQTAYRVASPQRPAEYLAGLLKQLGVEGNPPLADVRTRVVEAVIRRARQDAERLDDSAPLPENYPADGASLAIRVGQADAKLAAEGRGHAGDLIAELVRKGAAVGFPADLRGWERRSQIRLAVGWMTELINSVKPAATGPKSSPKIARDPEPAASA